MFLIDYILPFLAVLTDLCVFVHEMGHYSSVRWCGVGVEAFSVGLSWSCLVGMTVAAHAGRSR